MFRKIGNALPLALALVLAGCGGGGGSDGPALTGTPGSGTEGCTTDDRNEAVYDLMTDVYYWYEEVPEVDPTDYASPAALLDDIRYRPLDETYSYLTTVEEEDAFLSNAAYFGFGFSMAMTPDGRIFLREVFPDSPAEAAGMLRGDEILAIDGVDVSTMNSVQLNAAFGPDEQGHEVEFEIRHAGAADSETVTVAKDEVTATVVGTVEHDLGAANDTSYIYFRSFVEPAFDQLDTAFAAMEDKNDTKLVLDLRYNGGGLLSVAQHLGGLLAGETEEGEIIAELEFNDRYQDQNQEYLIELLANSVAITDLVVITTRSSASASEMIINGLAPFSDTINVATVGDNTYGKPVGQSRLEFCENDILRAVTFKVVNANGEGEYFRPTGIPPTCPADDDLTQQLGEAAEASLNEALYYLENRDCSATSVKAARQLARQKALRPGEDPLVRDGRDILMGGAR